jgi:hypothetical protein
MLVFALVATTIMAGAALAEPVAPIDLTNGTSERRNLSALSAQMVNAQAGNVTHINLTALAITQGWQGYYGNINGTIVLQNAAGDTFYDWTATDPEGEVYATRITNPDWSSVSCLDGTGIGNEQTALNMANDDPDSVNNTYDNTVSHPGFDVGGNTIGADSCYATNAYVNNNTQTASFFQVLLEENGGSIVYTTLINSSTTGFDGGTYDFQLLVGEDGHGAAASTVTPYYFWVEIN